MTLATFDRASFGARLTTRHLGRHLVVRAETASTNDDAWDALAQGAPDGAAVIADAQTRGRGRAGRTWHTTPGKGLALSLVLHLGCDTDVVSTLPLVIGLALVQGLERLGVTSQLKWPNDVLFVGRKLAGILCERRATASGIDAAVVGVGVNVSQEIADFAPEIRASAISLALAGFAPITREQIAAEFLNALEPLWTEHAEGDAGKALAEWSRRATFWGGAIVVRTAAGEEHGIARALDRDGALLVEDAAGALKRIVAGDVHLAAEAVAAPASPRS
jgi:BirA family transcriptional regulator, biotin operon repressor / biotin---[acetyl-CoA-carboxylase] ligase